MEGITAEDILSMIRHDLEGGIAYPERHIEKYVKRKCQEQRQICVVEVMSNSKGSYYELPTAQDRENIDNSIRNASEPKL